MPHDYKFQQGFAILLPLIILGVVLSGTGILGFVEYKKVSDKITQAGQLADEEKYVDAIGALSLAQASLLVKTIGAKETEIRDQLQAIEARKEQQVIYEDGLAKLDVDQLQDAVNVFLTIPENSFYYQKSQTKIEEAKRKVVEEELVGEKIVRKGAQEKAQQETIRRTQEEAARIVAEGKTKQEESARIVAEEKTRQEEAARKTAEQQTVSERLAKEQQQRVAESQRQRAEQEERARILELARTNPLIQAIVSGELKFYLDPLPSYAATDVANAVGDIAQAFSSLDFYGASVRRVYNSNDADLTIAWIRDYGSHTIGQAIFQAHVKVGLGTNNCVGSWSAFDANTVKKILWHELGHAMGYGHSNNSSNVMYGEIDTRFEVEQEISEVISGNWYRVFPLCGAGTYSYSFETDNLFIGFDLFMLPPGQNAYEISGGSGRYYPSCSSEGIRSYSGLCIVPDGAKIYIGNTSTTEAIPLYGRVIDMNERPWPDMNWDQSTFRYDSNQLTQYWELFH